MKINLVMIVKNEERSLRKCLKAAKPLVDQILIVDTGSSDKTIEIAKEMGAEVQEFSWVNDFSAARNFALLQSDADWNLVLDADEYIRPGSSRGRLEKILGSRKGIWLGGITLYDSYPDEGTISISTSVLPRLLPKGVRYEGRIHEQPEGDLPCYPVPLEADHDGYLVTDKGERNLPYLKQAAAEHPEDGYYQFQLASTLRNLKQLKESLPHFRKFYQITGKKDAYRPRGLVLYLYTLLDLGTSQYLDEASEIVKQEEQMLGNWSDFSFVCGLFYMKRVLSDVQRYIELLPNIEACYLRCLKSGERPELGGVVGTGSFKAAYNLGAWYEVSGQNDLAVKYYKQAAKEGYGPAKERLKEVNRSTL
ncbi:MAG: glycosyltransferase family 2 protein [Lachnospiraceae bacterium]|jgi:glycosyltransferase involved in cell wall biosynthesis|nr:glycosyltransferase family 2 protein [Lachnospiraceae bacterium]